MLHRVGKKMSSKMKQTIFNIEKLKNVVNIGSNSAYQIYTSPGEKLGTVGTIVNPGMLIPANDEKFQMEITGDTKEGVPTSWLTRVLAVLKS
jgi:hypothetical protein